MASGLNTQSNRTLRYEQRNHIKHIGKQKTDRIMRLERRNNSNQEIYTEVKNEIIQLNNKKNPSNNNSNNISRNSSRNSSMSNMSSTVSSIRRTRSSGLMDDNSLF